MNPCSYYSFVDQANSSFNTCSIESHRLPLLVNCTGCFSSVFPFTTHNDEGRLDYYLMYLLSGELTVSLPEGTRRAGAGDMILFPPRFPYRYTYEATEKRLSYLWVHFTGSFAEELLQQLALSPMPGMWRIGQDPHVSALFLQLFEGFHRNSPLVEHLRACLLEQILLSLGASLCEDETPPAPLKRSLRYIHTSYTKEIRIPDLARMENLSNSRYHTLFQRQIGTAPVRYIAELRIRHACELLRNTDLPVKQIGDLVGYHDPQFFSKLFKSHLGVSPSEYRKHQK